MQHKHFKYIFIAYSTILLVSMIVFYLFPRYASMEIGEKPIHVVDPGNFYDAALEDKLGQLDGVYLHKQWSFSHTGDHLEITSGQEIFDLWILVKRTAVGTGKVDLFEYRTETLVTDRVNLNNFILTGDTLRVASEEFCQVEFKAFNKEFAVTQFFGKTTDFHLALDQFWTHRALYLLVPANVEIVYDPNKMNLTFLDED